MPDCHQADNPGTLLARPGTAGSSHVETRTLALPKTGLAGSEVTGRLAATSDGAPVGAGRLLPPSATTSSQAGKSRRSAASAGIVNGLLPRPAAPAAAASARGQ